MFGISELTGIPLYSTSPSKYRYPSIFYRMFFSVQVRKRWSCTTVGGRKSLQCKSLQSVKICVQCTLIFTVFREGSCKDLRPLKFVHKSLQSLSGSIIFENFRFLNGNGCFMNVFQNQRPKVH